MQSQSPPKMTVEISSPLFPHDYLYCLTLPNTRARFIPLMVYFTLRKLVKPSPGLSLEKRRGGKWVREPSARCREYTSLIMHQEGESIRDCIHLMHEADVYVLKCSCLAAPSL